MAERKKLTDVQLKQLAETQGTLAQARALIQKAEQDAQRVVQLIFDAHGVPENWIADLDGETGELVCRSPEEVVADQAPAEA
jgi:multidrug resistance efflux pump